MHKRRGIVVLVALLAAVLVCPTGCTKEEAAEIPVGVSAAITGSIPTVGAGTKNAAELAVDEVNSAGGLEVGGKKYKIKLYIEDHENKPESATATVQRLITQRKVLAVIGLETSKCAIPAGSVAENSRVPMISSWSTNPRTTEGRKYVFRACFIDPFQGTVMADFAYNELGARKAAVLYDIANDYNKGIAEFFRDAFAKLGGQIVAFESYTTGDKDFTGQLTKIKAAGPDVLFLPNFYDEVPLQIQQARRLGITCQIIGSDSWDSPDLVKLGGEVMEGLFFSNHYSPDIATPEAKVFIDKYQKKYGQIPDAPAALAYDAFQLLFVAIQKAGKVDREAVRDALASIPEYKGVTGTLKFTGTGDPIKSAVIVQIKNGKFTYYKTVSPK